MSAPSGRRHPGSIATIGGVLIVTLAAGLSLAALIVGVIAQVDWSITTRLLITAVVYAPVAAVILPRRRPLLAVILTALALTSGALALVVVLQSVPTFAEPLAAIVPLAALLARLSELAAIATLPWLLVRRPGARRIGLAAGALAILVDVLAWAAIFSGLTVARWLVTGSLVIALLSLLAAAGMLVGQWRRAEARERSALTWFAAGAGLLLLSYARLLAPLPPVPAALADAAFLVATALLPTALLAMAVEPGTDRRGRLFATVVWAQSLAVAVALYLVVDAIVTAAGAPAALAGAVAAGALALSFGAVRRAVQERTGRLYFDAGADAETVLRSLGERIGQNDASQGLRAIAESLRRAWRLTAVEVAVAGESAPVVAGDPGPARISAPLVARGRTIGTIVLSGADETDLRATVAPVLEEVAPLVAVAVLLAVVNQEVDAARSRTLGVRREERRMLHRELHDELVPSLAGIGFAMAGTERLIRTGDLEGAARMLPGIRHEVAERAEDVRLLARSLLPAALDTGDLDGALRDLARRLSDDGSAMSVHALGMDVLEERLQIAVYLTVAEAVTRLRRAGRRDVDIRVALAEDEPAVRVRIASADVPAHVRADIRDALARRAAEVGGVVDVSAGEDCEWTAVIRR